MASRPERLGVANGGFACTFREIGEALGVGETGAHMAYQSAMRKLRERKLELMVLLELHRELESHRHGENSVAVVQG